MYEILEYTDDRGNRITARIKVDSGIRISNIPVDKEWTLTTQSASGVETVDFLGHKPKK